MRLILQRVTSASVEVAESTVARIGPGALVLAGVEKADSLRSAHAAAEKLAGLRIFEDDAGRMNLDAGTVGAEFLVVSQFTLAAQLGRGRRPSFDAAAPRDQAEPIVEELLAELRRRGFAVETGRFGARMQVALVNDGPVTFVVDV